MAPLVPADDGSVTWQVPPFVAGHADETGGAGGPGNAVLFGHVTSVHSGDVFRDLDQASVGDLVLVSSDARIFRYRVVDTRRVSRDNSDVLQPTDVPSVTLITCEGVWLPSIWDYTHRRVVRAELIPASTPGSAVVATPGS